MPIDFPDSPLENETYDAPNGVTYTWDGTKWTLRIQSEELLRRRGVRVRDAHAVSEQLQPKSSGDEILFDSLGIDYLAHLPA